MRLKATFLGQQKKWLLGSLIGLNIAFIHSPAHAFVPYIFEPNKKDLKNASITFGQTAIRLIQYGQAKEASRVAKLAVRLNASDETLWSILAETQVRNKLLKEAKISLAKAKDINPSNARHWFAEGAITLQQRDPKNAILLIEKGLTIEPKNANAYFQLGNAHIMEFNLNSALKSFEKASEIKPKFWEAINNQALVLFELGKINQAIKTWRNVLKIEKNAEPMLALAAALNQTKGNKKESIELAKKALAKNPNYVSAKHQADQLWGTKLLQATKELFKEADLNSDIERALTNAD